MPNWCYNQVTVEGDAKEVKKFLEFIAGDEPTGDKNTTREKQYIDFNKIVPMPEVIRYSGSGNCTIEGKQSDAWYERTIDGKEVRRLFTAAEKKELLKIGHKNWYDWSCEKWGTKWNATNSQLEKYNDGMYVLTFNTAWGAPDPIYTALKKKFRTLEITCRARYEDDEEYPHEIG